MPKMPADPCKDCGKCCQHLDRPPFNLLFDHSFTRIHTGQVDGGSVKDWQDYPIWERIPDELKREVEEDRQSGKRPPDSPCLWYDPDTKKCRHYELRPTVCRDFTPGEPACNKFRIQLGLKRLPRRAATY